MVNETQRLNYNSFHSRAHYTKVESCAQHEQQCVCAGLRKIQCNKTKASKHRQKKTLLSCLEVVLTFE